MAYSVRFYLRDGIDIEDQMDSLGLIESIGKVAIAKDGSVYIEIKTEFHLLAHLDEFIPANLRREFYKLTKKVTLRTENHVCLGLKKDTLPPTRIGSSVISVDHNKVMMVGTRIELMIKAYLLFCKYDGVVPDFKDKEVEQKLGELGKAIKDLDAKYREALKESRQLAAELSVYKDTYKTNIFMDAFAFLFDKDARKASGLYFPSGRPMSVREAKARNLKFGDI